MIEAVNSILANAAASRGTVEQQSTARSLSANPEKVQEAARVPYVSPYISVDRNFNRAILQIRDSDTGDVVRQFPTEGQLRAYQNAQQFSERQKAQADSQLRQASGGSSTPRASVEAPTVADVAPPQASSGDVSVPTTPVQTEA